MGDMTDLILMSQDPYDDDWGDEYNEGPPISYKTCSMCGQKGLVWVTKYNGKWRLGDPYTMEVHKCHLNI